MSSVPLRPLQGISPFPVQQVLLGAAATEGRETRGCRNKASRGCPTLFWQKNCALSIVQNTSVRLLKVRGTGCSLMPHTTLPARPDSATHPAVRVSASNTHTPLPTRWPPGEKQVSQKAAPSADRSPGWAERAGLAGPGDLLKVGDDWSACRGQRRSGCPTPTPHLALCHCESFLETEEEPASWEAGAG